MRILHLTDLHYSAETDEYDFRALFRDLLKALKKEQEQKKIDLVFVTGDLVDRGGKSFPNGEGFKRVEKTILSEIASTLSLPKEKIVFCPGNHDIEEPDDDTYLRGVRAFSEILEVNKRLKSGSNTWNSLSGLKRFKEFEMEYYKNAKETDIIVESSYWESNFIFNFGNAKVGITAFNSAWSCCKDLDKNDKYKLCFGTIQIKRASEILADRKTDFNIALMHHPLDMGFYGEEEEKEMKEDLYNGGYTLLFCGHTHKVYDKFAETPTAKYHVIVTKSSIGNSREKKDDYKPGYSLIDVSYQDNERIAITRWYRKYAKGSGFGFDTSESVWASSSVEHKPLLMKEKFIEYLKPQNDTDFKPERELLLSRLTFATNDFMSGDFPEISKKAAGLLSERVFKGSLEFNQVRRNLKVKWTISADSQPKYFRLREQQSYEIECGKDFIFKAYTYLDRFVGDDSELTILKFMVNDSDVATKFSSTEIELDDAHKLPVKRIQKRLEYPLEGKKRYRIDREQTSLNSSLLNNIWKYDYNNIYTNVNVEMEIKGNYQIEFFNIWNNKSYTNLDSQGNVTQILTIPTIEMIVPGDKFWIFIKEV